MKTRSSNTTPLFPHLFRASAFVLVATLTGCANVPLRQSSQEFGPLAAIDSPADVIAPRPLDTVAPRYPYKMASLGWETQLRVKCLVDEQGTVREAEAVNSSMADYPFSDAAVDAVKKWRFTPGTRDGVPAGMWVTIPFEFELLADAPASRS